MFEDMFEPVGFHCAAEAGNFFNPFSTNVPLTDKLGNWFLKANYLVSK